MPQETLSYGTAAETPDLGLIDQEDEGKVEDGTGILWDGVNENSILFLTAFGFAIPGTATIDGIEINQIGRSEGPALYALPYNGLDFQFTKDGATGAGESFDPNDVTTAQYHVDYSSDANTGYNDKPQIGGPADLHETTWTPTVVNDAGFGIIITVRGTELDFIEIDLITITIYYSDAGGSVVTATLCSENMHYIAQGIRSIDAITKRS